VRRKTLKSRAGILLLFVVGSAVLITGCRSASEERSGHGDQVSFGSSSSNCPEADKWRSSAAQYYVQSNQYLEDYRQSGNDMYLNWANRAKGDGDLRMEWANEAQDRCNQ
jgi:hypothetical protein